MRNLFRSLSYLIVLILVLSPAVSGQGLPAVSPEEVGLSGERLERIDTVVEQYIDENKVAGVVALVARKGKIAHLKAFGMSDIEAKKPMRTDTIFRMASMTKPITTVAVMMLYEEGHFLLNDPLSKFIPEFRDMKVLVPSSPGEASSRPYTLVPAKNEITILNLLNHTSGITYGIKGHEHIARLYSKAGISDGLTQTEGTIGDTVKKMAKMPLVNHPGEAFHYGLSIDVLGYFVEVISGMPLDEFFRERIFKPLGMKDSYFFLPDDKVSRLAALYESTADGGIRRAPEFPVVQGYTIHSSNYHYQGPRTYFSGGAGIVSTIDDYTRFLQMILNGGELEGARLLSRKSVELMTNNSLGDLWNEKEKFGLGFGIRPLNGHFDELGTAGTYRWSGYFGTNFWVDPEEEMIMIILTQLRPRTNLNSKFKVLAYQAVVD
ncbi:serine hydrolase domain-containing protein [Candidatus Latescibacterota bacterium]